MHACWEEANKVKIPEDYKNVENIVMCEWWIRTWCKGYRIVVF